MSNRKSKKRIGSTRRHLGHKAEEKEDNEELQECSTTHHLQLSTEMPKSHLDDISENVESDNHDPSETISEKLVVPAELCEAETSTSGKKRRIGSTRRAKQGFQMEERKEEDEKVQSIPMKQEELSVTKTEDQYLQEKSDVPELAQAHVQLPELGGNEVRELTKRTSDESPNEEHSLLLEPDLKTEAGTCSTEVHSHSQSFSQNPETAVNFPFCVTDPHSEEGEGIHKQDEQSFFNLFEAKEVCSNVTPFQNTPQGLDLQKDQNAEDIRKYDEQSGAKEVTLEASLNMETINAKENTTQHILHIKESQEEMQIKKVGNEPLEEMEVRSAGNQCFLLQMPQGNSSPTTAESISMIKEDLQIFQPSNTKTDGTVIESYDKSGIQNTLQTEQNTSISLSQGEDKNPEHNVQKPKKRMGSTRKHIKGLKMTEDIGNSQTETQDMKEKTFQGLKLTEESVEENTHFRIMTAFNDKLETDFTVSERGAESEGAGDESEEQRNAHKDQILDENTEGAMATVGNKAFHSTENITDDSWIIENSSISCFVREGDLDHHSEIDSEGGTNTNQERRPVVEIFPPRVLGEQISEQMSIQTLDEETLQTRTPQDNAIQDTQDKSELTENAHFTLEFTHSYFHSFGGTENTGIDQNKITKESSPMITHREEMADNPLDMQCESFIQHCTKTGKSDTEATEKAENITNQSEKEILSDTFSFFEVADHFKGDVMRQDVDQLQRCDEEEAEKCPESPEDQEMKNSTNMEVSQQEVENQLLSPTEDSSPDYAGTTAEDTDAIKDSKPFFPQSELDILSESVDPLEQHSPLSSPATGHIPEITDVTTNVHLESSSPELYSPDVQHREDTEQGTQPHSLSSTMESPNNSTDISDGLHNGQTRQTVSHSLTVESTDMSETHTMSDHSESTFTFQHSEEEDEQEQEKQHQYVDIRQQLDANYVTIEEADNKIALLPKETAEVVTTVEADSFNEVVMSGNVEQPKKHADEKPVKNLDSLGDRDKQSHSITPESTHMEVSQQAEFQNNLSYASKNPSQDCADIRIEDAGVTEKPESLFCQIGVGSLSEASGPLEQDQPTSSSASDYTQETANVPLIMHTERSSPEIYSPDVQLREEDEQETQPHTLSSTIEPEIPNNSTDISDVLHSGQTKPTVSNSLNLESTEMSETSTLSDHSESTFKIQHSEEEISVKQGASRQRKKMGSTRRIKRDQQREETCDAMTTDGDHANEDVNVQINTNTLKTPSEDCVGMRVEDVGVTEKPESLFCEISVGNLSEALGPSEQELPTASSASDYSQEIADVPLIVHTERSSPEIYSPDVQLREEDEQETQPHTLSSTMEPEIPNNSTDISDVLHSGQTKQTVSNSLNLESTEMSETSTLSDHSESTFKLQHSEEEISVKQGASNQRKKMGSTRRIKRDQQKEETCDATTTDGDHASEDINIQMNTDTGVRAEEEILDVGITDAMKENEFFPSQTDDAILSMTLSTVDHDQYVDSSPSAEGMSSSFSQCSLLQDEQEQEKQHLYVDIGQQLDGNYVTIEEADNKIALLPKETAEVITTVEANSFNEVVMSGNVEQLKKHEDEESVKNLDSLGDQDKQSHSITPESTHMEVSQQAEFQNNLSYATKNLSQDCADIRIEDVGVIEKPGSLFCQIGVGNLAEVSGPLEQEHPTSSSASDYTQETADVPLIMESTEMSENSTLSDHSESTFKLQHSEEEISVKQGASRQRKKMGSTRRIKRDQQREETCDATTTDGDHASEDVNVQMNTNTLKTPSEDCVGMRVEDVGVTEKPESVFCEISVGNLSEALGPSEQELLAASPAPDYTPEIADVPLTVHAESYSPEIYSPDVQHREDTEQGTQPHVLSSTMEPEVPNNGTPQASESQQVAETHFLSHSFNIESSGIAETRALSDNCASPLGFQYQENEGSLKSSMSMQKRKIGSTRRQKRESNEVNLDEGTRSPHETEEITTEGMVTETVEIKVQQEETLQSEQISSGEKIQSACLNTIPGEGGLNEYQAPMKDESKNEHNSTQEQDKIQDQVKNTIPEMSVSASQYPETEESPSLTRRKKLSSTRRHGRDQQEKTERKYVVMDGMLIYTDTETSSCHANKSMDREIHDEENAEVPCISVNTMVSPPTPELLKTDQESGDNEFQSKDELPEEHQHILASTITTSDQAILEDITSNQTFYSSHEDTQADKPVSSVTQPVDSLSSENILMLPPLENSDSIEESKPRKKRMGSSRKLSNRQKMTGKNENNGEEDVKDEVSDNLTITAEQPLQLETQSIDICATDKQELECTRNDKWTNIDQSECSETASGPHNQPEVHSITGIYDQSPSGKIEISESSGTITTETSFSKLNDDDNQNEPKSMLQKRKMGSSRRGQGLGNRMKGEAAKVEEHMNDTTIPRQEGNDTTPGALPLNEEGSKQKESCLVLLQNTQDLSVEREQLLPAFIQSSDSYPQSVAQTEGPDESTDERVQPASNPSTNPQTSVKKRKMGSTRKDMRRQGEEEKSDPKRDQGSPESSVDDTAWDSTIVPTETVTIQKITPSQEPEGTLPKDESSENGCAAPNESPQDAKRKLSSRRGGLRGTAPPEEPEDQHVSKGPENDSSISKGTQENVHREGVAEQGLVGFEGGSPKVEQPVPLEARIKSDLERKYGQGDTLTSLDETVSFNVVMVGESSVGKTSFIRRFESGQFFLDHSATIGVDTFVQTLAVDDKLVKLQIWDTAGQERFHSITRQVLHKAQGLILMYDISSCETFSAVRKWIACIEEVAPSEVIILLLGNKNDSEERQVLPPEGERLAQEYNIHFMECSAATGHNVTQAMETMARLLQQTVKVIDKGNVILHNKPQQKSSCC